MKIKVQMTDEDFEPLQKLMYKHITPMIKDHTPASLVCDIVTNDIRSEIESIANRAFEAGRTLSKLESLKNYETMANKV